MWYHIKAKDMSIYKPEGKVITFSIWADSEDKTILKSTNEEWTPEWVNSESDVEEKEIEKPKENPFW